ncbi:TetR/AcrR family transcriptional regulator [Paenactinomyces guangxiensis]|uniref:TetR/AcrR family transcriptional regulator n=1 Tax=Paenactinomyces guangxiensis TaxID=1490290 RepID=A0A7W1WT27_9BACL|nr:TetR/AcrR family transcriptional regulator [Paenactinomyces guangxiensis]MBA4495550.1 TetR/AcrR family transcriptional regulator [Paenactinomyces guangxiensis]MBH8592808.1 TetR/AcrR family transcriptional regulator [Paenactinomyces guangxiensis]
MLFTTQMPAEPRDKMFYAALHLFTTKGFKETSILEIVEQARVSKTTFYHYFHSKEELLVRLCKQLAEEMLEEVEIAVQSEEKLSYKAYAGIHRYIEICVTRSTVAKLLLMESVGVSQAVEEVRREAHRRFADLIDRTVQSVILTSLSAEEVRVVSQAMVGAINEVVIQNIFESGENVHLDQLARLLNRIVVGAFVNLSLREQRVSR